MYTNLLKNILIYFQNTAMGLEMRFLTESLHSLGEETVCIILHLSALYWSMLHKYAGVLVNVTCAN